jgi:hypothetical protein
MGIKIQAMVIANLSKYPLYQCLNRPVITKRLGLILVRWTASRINTYSQPASNEAAAYGLEPTRSMGLCGVLLTHLQQTTNLDLSEPGKMTFIVVVGGNLQRRGFIPSTLMITTITRSQSCIEMGFIMMRKPA